MIVDCPDGSGTRNVPVADQLGPDMIRAQCLTAAEIMQLVQYGRRLRTFTAAIKTLNGAMIRTQADCIFCRPSGNYFQRRGKTDG